MTRKAGANTLAHMHNTMGILITVTGLQPWVCISQTLAHAPRASGPTVKHGWFRAVLEGRVPPIELQEFMGTCWDWWRSFSDHTHAWFAMVTYICLKENEYVDYSCSEKHVQTSVYFPQLELSVCLQLALLSLCCSKTEADGIFTTSGKTWHLWFGFLRF